MTIAESPAAAPVGHQGARVDITERPAFAVNGWFGVIVLAGCLAGAIVAGKDGTPWTVLPALVFVLVFASLAIVPPGQTSVVLFFGRYIGTIRRPGFWWVLPLTVRRGVSVRASRAISGLAAGNGVSMV